MQRSSPMVWLAVAAAVVAPLPGDAQGRECACQRGRDAQAVAAPAPAEQAAPAQPGAGPAEAKAEAEERPEPFAASSLCAWCHSNAEGARAMRDPKRREVSPFLLWSGTAMASSFRDVVWQAAVAAEVAAAPSREREIVATCIRCHAPMGARTLPPDALGLGLLAPGKADALTADGVSCAVCHRISADGLGEPSSFVGAFQLVPDGQIAGPHRDPFTRPMLHHTGFEPVYGAQLLHSGLCGTCHTVITTPLGGGDGAAPFVEQAPYLEWRNSVFASEGTRGATCQACHLPTLSEDGARIRTRIARNPRGFDFPPLDDRSPYGRHVLVGGNTLLPRLLASAPATGAEAGEVRPPYDQVAALAAAQLSTRTARVEIERARRAGGALSFVARVVNLTGHKFPTGHPSRRAWLRVRVRDAAGRIVLASGEHDAAGRILGASGAPLESEAPGGPVEPHRATVRGPDEVQVWESVMEDGQGALTETLLAAARPRKDDRLLPAGWSPAHPDAARTRPVGTGDDADFVAGEDRVAFQLDLPASAKGPLRLEVALLYQPLGARHAAALTRGEGEPAKALAAALARTGNAPDTVAVARRSVK
jgi:cytochrome c553